MAIVSVLAVNCGSSSLKATFFSEAGDRIDYHYAHMSQENPQKSLSNAFQRLLSDLGDNKPKAIGHRFVHGGDITDPARSVDKVERVRLGSLIHLAPQHLPSNLLGLDLCEQRFKVPQVACFDTAFHSTMSALSKRLPIPQELGFSRFGFHGLNYAHIARVLPTVLAQASHKKVVIAHLGSGASLCLLEDLKSVETTMGYTPAGGVPMGSRSGDLDPGVMLELARRFNSEQLEDLVFHKMGLLSLSNGESSDMKDLLSSNSKEAKFAVEYFCRQVRGAIGALASKVGGIDALVFTAGIGEHSPVIREKICTPLSFLGFVINEDANKSATKRIERRGYKPIIIIPADEEAEIALLVEQVCVLSHNVA